MKNRLIFYQINNFLYLICSVKSGFTFCPNFLLSFMRLIFKSAKWSCLVILKRWRNNFFACKLSLKFIYFSYRNLFIYLSYRNLFCQFVIFMTTLRGFSPMKLLWFALTCFFFARRVHLRSPKKHLKILVLSVKYMIFQQFIFKFSSIYIIMAFLKISITYDFRLLLREVKFLNSDIL